jgi:uncharacterized protein (TIGR02466 family)
MNLILNQWFTTPIWQTYIDIDVNPLISYLYKLKESNDGTIVSNRHGWQSSSLLGIPLAHEDLLYKINQVLVEVHKQMGLTHKSPSIVTSHWYNINPPGSYNVRHIHPHSVFSGVFYLQVPGVDSGNITFYRENMFKSYFPHYIVDDWNAMTSEHVKYEPEKLMLLIFPSCIEHDVSENLTAEDRISFSFNTKTHFY